MMHINGILYHFNISAKHDIFHGKRIIKDDILEIPKITGELAIDYFDSYVGTPLLLINNSPTLKKMMSC